MLSLSNLLCEHRTGSEWLRYGHVGSGRETRPPRPVVVWALTRACNLRCVHCYASARSEPLPNELTLVEGMELLEDLREFEVPAVLFSGGEPLARPEALKLLHFAQVIGLSCTLSTNGVLIDDAMADRLADIGLKYVGISIDGVGRRHDKLRGRVGSFDAALAGIDRCRRRGIRVGLRFTVHGLNVDELDSVFDLALAHDVQRLCVYHLAYAGRGGKMQRVDLTPERTRAVVDRLIQRTRDSHAAGSGLEVLTVGNHADAAYLVLRLRETDPTLAGAVAARLAASGGNRSGCNIASIDPVGDVHYDQFSWHYACGNVRRARFSRIWSEASDVRLAILRDRRDHLPQRCGECAFLPLCNGNLRTRAETATGDWLGLDPGCYLTDQETRCRIEPEMAAVN